MHHDYFKHREEYFAPRERDLYDVIARGGFCETANQFKRLAMRYLREAEAYRALAYEAHMRYFAPKFRWSLSVPKRFAVLDEAALAFYADFSCQHTRDKRILRTVAKVEKPSGSPLGESTAPIQPPSAKGENSGMRTPGT